MTAIDGDSTVVRLLIRTAELECDEIGMSGGTGILVTCESCMGSMPAVTRPVSAGAGIQSSSSRGFLVRRRLRPSA